MWDLLSQIQSSLCCSQDVQELDLKAQEVKDSQQIMPKQEAVVEAIQILANSHSPSSQSEELELKMKAKFYTRCYQMNLLIWRDSIYRYLVCMNDINITISTHETFTICPLPAIHRALVSGILDPFGRWPLKRSWPRLKSRHSRCSGSKMPDSCTWTPSTHAKNN